MYKKNYFNFSTQLGLFKPADLDKWLSAFRNIRAKVYQGLSHTDAFNQETKEWDVMEKQKFSNWLKFYESGEHEKYVTAESYYVNDSLPGYFIPNVVRKEDSNASMDAETLAAKDKESKEQEKRSKMEVKRKKILGRLNSLEKLLGDVDAHLFAQKELEHLVDAIFNLKRKIMTLNTIASERIFADLIVKEANVLSYNSFENAAKYLFKFADMGYVSGPNVGIGLNNSGSIASAETTDGFLASDEGESFDTDDISSGQSTSTEGSPQTKAVSPIPSPAPVSPSKPTSEPTSQSASTAPQSANQGTPIIPSVATPPSSVPSIPGIPSIPSADKSSEPKAEATKGFLEGMNAEDGFEDELLVEEDISSIDSNNYDLNNILEKDEKQFSKLLEAKLLQNPLVVYAQETPIKTPSNVPVTVPTTTPSAALPKEKEKEKEKEIEVYEEPEEEVSVSSNNFDDIVETAFSNVTVLDVIKKLEELANIFKTREISRQLAITDLMLDRLNLAPFFPSLAEASNKTLESNQYCLSRIDEVLSRLRGAVDHAGASTHDLYNLKSTKKQTGLNSSILSKKQPSVKDELTERVKENLQKNIEEDKLLKEKRKLFEKKQVLEKETPREEPEELEVELEEEPVKEEAEKQVSPAKMPGDENVPLPKPTVAPVPSAAPFPKTKEELTPKPAK